VIEQVFRFNNRKDMTDGQGFDLAVRQITGKRLRWNTLTGKECKPRASRQPGSYF